MLPEVSMATKKRGRRRIFDARCGAVAFAGPVDGVLQAGASGAAGKYFQDTAPVELR